MMTPAARQSLTWSACLATGYACFMLMGEFAIAYAGVSAELWNTRFWVRCGVAVVTSLALWPVFFRFARRPGFLDSYGQHLTTALLALTLACVFTAVLGAETPAGLRLLAALVGARVS